MPNMRLTLFVAALLVGCAPARHEQPDSAVGSTGHVTVTAPAGADSTAHATGFGPVRAGMTVAEAAQALGAPLVPRGPGLKPCDYV
jgi:hypothetical protein